MKCNQVFKSTSSSFVLITCLSGPAPDFINLSADGRGGGGGGKGVGPDLAQCLVWVIHQFCPRPGPNPPSYLNPPPYDCTPQAASLIL